MAARGLRRLGLAAFVRSPLQSAAPVPEVCMILVALPLESKFLFCSIFEAGCVICSCVYGLSA
jgi:hypothetical protein